MKRLGNSIWKWK